jgi:hypothetical protein
MPHTPLPFVPSPSTALRTGLSKQERTPSILPDLRVHFDGSLTRALSANGVFP